MFIRPTYHPPFSFEDLVDFITNLIQKDDKLCTQSLKSQYNYNLRKERVKANYLIQRITLVGQPSHGVCGGDFIRSKANNHDR
jgi:hypothetical protein